MTCCDLTLSSPEENLACDEALLDLCDEGASGEVLRFWEPAQYFVAVGYANKVASEVNTPFCRRHALPILRRCSGGGTVLQGPGCLNYSLILELAEQSPVQTITATNHYVLERHRAALAPLLPVPVEAQGQTDLALGGRKFSGNAQRRKRRALLFHGSLLLDFDLALIEQALPLPSKQPDYRANRAHADFLTNLQLPAREIKTALTQAWRTAESPCAVPLERIGRLVREKYACPDWNLRF